SERTGLKRRYQDRITDLSMLTDALSLRGPVVTVGHDWGGLISAGWALDNRHDLAGMILTNTGVHQELEESLPKALQLATAPWFRRGGGAEPGRGRELEGLRQRLLELLVHSGVGEDHPGQVVTVVQRPAGGDQAAPVVADGHHRSAQGQCVGQHRQVR